MIAIIKSKVSKDKNIVKYTYEFEMDNDKFKKGDCYECPLSYIKCGDDDYSIWCVLNAKYYECPLKEEEQCEIQRELRSFAMN